MLESPMPNRFQSLPLPAELLEVLQELKLTELTPIQSSSIPLLLEGRDLIGQSKTGSGKTIAFALPILARLEIAHRQVQALVLSPTRELAAQVAREIRRLGRRFPGLNVALLVGGQPIGTQLGGLEMGAHIAVGTPGRVLDHLRRGSLGLEACARVVLDEADRMLDMGFAEEMEEVLAALPEKRQTVFFSATFPDSIESLSERYQQEPARVEILDEEKNQIRQIFYPVDEKLSALLAILHSTPADQAIVFCNQKATVAGVAKDLRQAGFSVDALHGDLEQQERDRVMAKFRNTSIRILVATDVAARGIDVADLALVVNYDLPPSDVYMHRIGRTGRAGKSGLAVSLVGTQETHKAQAITKICDVEKSSLPSVASPAPPPAALMTTLYVSGGRKEKVRPGDLLGALTGEAGGLNAKDVGKIEIHDHFSYVAVATYIAEIALYRLRDGRIKGRKFRIEMVR